MIEKWTGRVRVSVMVECIAAAHLASYVRGPVKDRGGVMLVGPPGQLKSTVLDILESNYATVHTASTLNTTTLMKMHGQLTTGQLRSLVIPDLHSIYAGDPRTAARLESTLMQLAAEGSRGASWEDTRHSKFLARAAVFSAMTMRLHARKRAEWEDSGFLRRFLWCTYVLEDAEILMDAIEQWKRADLGNLAIPVPPTNGEIPDMLTDTERARIRAWLQFQPFPHETQFSFLCRMASVLRWHYKSRRSNTNAIERVKEFAELLQKDHAVLVVDGDRLPAAVGQ